MKDGEILEQQLDMQLAAIRDGMSSEGVNELWLRRKLNWTLNILEHIVNQNNPEYRSQSRQGTRSQSDDRHDTK
jgi:hypothetical protein